MIHNIDNEGPFQTLTKFLGSVGVSRSTGWRWRQLGWLECVPIAGRAYVTKKSVDEFLKRAEAGEFAELTATDRSNLNSSASGSVSKQNKRTR